MSTRFLFMIVLFFLVVKNSYAQVELADSTVRMSTSVDNTVICPDKKEAYLYIELNASKAAKRLPLNISIVLDRSGSMEEEDRLHNAKIALKYLIDHLMPQDICSIVIYDHLAEVLHGATNVTDKEYLKRKIDHIKPGGSTNIGMGLQLGFQEVKYNYSPDKINRVILLSDGIANEGITDDYLLEMMVREHSRKDGITTSTFGMGHEFNEKLMHNLAEYGSGNYYFVERSEDAINDFTSEVKMLEGVVAKNGYLKIKYPSNNLTISHLFGFPYTVNKDEIVIDLKEVHPGETHGVLVKFYIKNMPQDSMALSSSLQYLNVNTLKNISTTQNLSLKTSTNTDDCNSGLNQDVFDKIVFFSSNYYLDSAADHAEKGDFQSANSTLASARKMHETARYRGNSKMCDQQYQLLAEYQTELDKNKNASSEKLKLIHKRYRHKNYKLRKMTNKCP